MSDDPVDPAPVADGAARGQRTQPRELRRRQLIESTIDCIARRGLAETRMADVAAGAGMSVGIVNFHFDSKQTLLTETLRFLADEYHRSWERARTAAPDDPAAQLEALVRMNFEHGICNVRRIAVWYAFFGEARSRPTYRDLCQQLDDDYLDQLTDLFGELFGSEAGARPRRCALMMMALWDGSWQNILLNPGVFTAEKAMAACLDWLSCLLPGRFQAEEAEGHG